MRTLFAGEGEGVCSGVGDGGTVCSGEIDDEGGSPTIGEGVGVGDSCPSAKEDKIMITNERMALVVISSRVETSLTV
jgi:hypothetical protein